MILGFPAGVIIGWAVVWGIIGAVVGQAKSGKAGAAFVVSVLLGPIGVLIVAVMPAGGSTAMATCPYCRERIQIGALVCKHCHSQMPPPAALPPAGYYPDQRAGQERVLRYWDGQKWRRQTRPAP